MKPNTKTAAPDTGTGPAAAVQMIRDRIKEFRRVPAADLLPSPENLKDHPEEQRVNLRAILREVGYAGAAIAYPRESDGKLELIDGHLRQEEALGAAVPTLILDVNDSEARLLRTLYDPMGDLARVNGEKVQDILAKIDAKDDALQVMLLELSGYGKPGKPLLDDEADTKDGPPAMLLRPYEHYDYILVLARNTMDWQALCTMFGLSKVDASPIAGLKKIGLGRCIDAGALLKKLRTSDAAAK